MRKEHVLSWRMRGNVATQKKKPDTSEHILHGTVLPFIAVCLKTSRIVRERRRTYEKLAASLHTCKSISADGNLQSEDIKTGTDKPPRHVLVDCPHYILLPTSKAVRSAWLGFCTMLLSCLLKIFNFTVDYQTQSTSSTWQKTTTTCHTRSTTGSLCYL